jgi:hypothetical protein
MTVAGCAEAAPGIAGEVFISIASLSACSVVVLFAVSS